MWPAFRAEKSFWENPSCLLYVIMYLEIDSGTFCGVRIRTIRIRFFLDLCGHKFVALPHTLLNRDLLHYFIWRMIKTCPTVKSKFRRTSWMLSLAAVANYLYMCCCLLEYYSVPLLFVCFWLPTLSIPIVIRTWVNNNNKYFTNFYMQ